MAQLSPEGKSRKAAHQFLFTCFAKGKQLKLGINHVVVELDGQTAAVLDAAGKRELQALKSEGPEQGRLRAESLRSPPLYVFA